jgi:hypothetical protein
MPLLIALLLTVAVVCALLRAAAVHSPRVDLGWVAIALVIAAVWLIPALSGL